MSHFNLCTRVAAAALALAGSSLAFAGNVPQYSFSKGGAPYKEITDGIQIPFTWPTGTLYLWPDMTMPGGYYATPNTYTAKGFPIGFNFNFAGTVVNQFAVASNGAIFVGYDEVTHDVNTGAFRIGMTPVMHGVGRGELSYATDGEEGNRVFTMQFKRCKLAEQTYGLYDLQIRLYEADGKIELAFSHGEEESDDNGFDTGITGWSIDDAIRLTANGIDSKVSLSPEYFGDMLKPNSFISWDIDDLNAYSPTFVFTPCKDTKAPENAPKNLELNQVGSTLNITCERAEGADATVVLFSPEPFTDNDMPEDGRTFPVDTRFGNAQVLYYGNSETINLSVEELEAGEDYYVRAISCNGYPAFNRKDVTEKRILTPQACPTRFTAQGETSKIISFEAESPYKIIVASTTEDTGKYQAGYVGVFGEPKADAKVGDELTGGGKVVYVGDPGHYEVEVEPNTLTYLRSWTVNEDVVSKTAADAAAVPLPSFPYEPRLEDYPYGMDLIGWTGSQYNFSPWRNGDVHFVNAKSNENNLVTLTSPALPLSGKAKLSFEFGLETSRGVGKTPDSGDVEVPLGRKPGVFGKGGFLKVNVDGQNLLNITNYNGTMTSNGMDGFIDYTATFEPQSVEIPAVGNGKTITFEFNSEEETWIFLRNIKIEMLDKAPVLVQTITIDPTEATVGVGKELDLKATAAPENAADKTLGWRSSNEEVATVDFTGRVRGVALGSCIITAYALDGGDARAMCKLTVDDGHGVEGIEVINPEDLEVYNLFGVRMNVESLDALAPGIYIVNGVKVVIK